MIKQVKEFFGLLWYVFLLLLALAVIPACLYGGVYIVSAAWHAGK